MSLTALPPWDNSAMDGYAVRAADIAARDRCGAGPPRRSIGEVRAGAAPETAVERGTAIRIATGRPDPAAAPTPSSRSSSRRRPTRTARRPGERGRDAAGPAARRRSSSTTAVAARARRSGRAGDDLAEARRDPRGRDAARRRRRSRSPPDPGNDTRPASTAGRGSGSSRPATRSAPRAAPSGPAGIPDANGPGLAALAEEAGGEAMTLGIAADRLEDVRARLQAALARRRRRDRRVGRRLGRAVRRRPGGVRGDRPDGAVAGRRPARQAVRVRRRRSAATAAGRCCSGCPATRSRAS